MLIAAASQPLQAWEAPAQHELAALLGNEPQATALDGGIPLPPSASEVRKLGTYRFEQDRKTIKLVLVYRTSLAKSERGRITEENNKACARMAQRMGAPVPFIQYLELLGSNTLSRRQQYAAEQAFRLYLQDTYAIDTLQMRLVSESVSLPAHRHMLFMLQLPVSGLFDCVSKELPPREQVMYDIQTMSHVLRRVDEILRTVRDTHSADAAAQAMQTLLPLWNTTQQTRFHAQTLSESLTPAERMSIQLLDSVTARLVEARRVLHQKKWYDSTTLQAIDELFR